MKKITLLLFCLIPSALYSQIFDYYGPQPFGEILDNDFAISWTPATISDIENRKYVVLLDAETKTTAIGIGESDLTSLKMIQLENITDTYGSVMRSIFQIVDINTHLDQQEIPLLGEFTINPMLHSYYGINSSSENNALLTDGGTRYVSEQSSTGFVLVVFTGSSESAVIKAVSQWEYSAELDSVVEADGWTEKWLKIDGETLSWTGSEGDATAFYFADATDLIELTIEDGSDFNPLNVSYQPNATAALPEVHEIDDSPILSKIALEVADIYEAQFGTSEDAAAAASDMLDAIETRLSGNDYSLRYPKEFYLALRENMLSHTFASSDVYNAKLGYNTVPHVFFTNAADDDGVPHPFMVVASHAASTRPNLLVDVNRPPGSLQGVGYTETPVTRHGKLGEFILKVPLRDYGLINSLLDNDLSPYGDLASDFDMMQGSTTVKNEYNYAGTASVGTAVDGVTIYPAQNNNLRFAVEDAEVTHSGIHVGGGLELHYHADGHAFSGNGINLYNISDFEGHDHPPVIGMGHDGIALFGKYEASHSEMVGFDIELDSFGGHDHEDGFGYHYHAHTQTVESSTDPNAPGSGSSTMFEEHFLMVGAWKGNINNIPGFDEGKMSQYANDEIARYAGASYEGLVSSEDESLNANKFSLHQNYPNPFNPATTITYELSEQGNVELKVFDLLGREVAILINNQVQSVGIYSVNFDASALSSGIYTYQLKANDVILKKKMTLIK
ncbi:MAG: T9SS type A sorting domain-containing protein [Balneolaceae bacterium]|nr:T9SS type A sorting domain-containing protein [Balneolaceae bacterium]MBO6546711.1 T9SS type A sorting domain-containing protein [Balneolaceae bacterium]MBO6649069.1 T9SS type A sorting domain-containing protein [Balneolaceae bacterium]